MKAARAALALVIVVLAATALAACGSSGSSATGDQAGDGKAIFNDAGCAGCHKFAPAGSGDGSGPDLDGAGLDAAAVAAQVKSGGGGMPSFDGDLTPKQIDAVAKFVADGDGSQ